MQNGFVESFDGRTRDELLNKTLSFDLDDARTKVTSWVADFNTARPDSALGYLTPVSYAANFIAMDDRLRNPDQYRRSSVAPTAPHGVKTRRVFNCRWMTSQWEVIKTTTNPGHTAPSETSRRSRSWMAPRRTHWHEP